MQNNNRFNPNDYLINLKSKNGEQQYLPVQWRLVWFREQCPQGTIDTEEIIIDLDREVEAEAFIWNKEKGRSEKIVKRARGYARFRAVVTDGKGGRATGTKSENAASFPDFIEKAETGAIGRALAGLGYGTQFAPELWEEERIVDAPVTKPSPAQTTTEPAHITANQRAAISHLYAKVAKPGETAPRLDMSYEEAKEMIKSLSAQIHQKDVTN